MGFEPTPAERNGLAVHRLNHSATSSYGKQVSGLKKKSCLESRARQKNNTAVFRNC